MFSRLMDTTSKGKHTYALRTICEVHRELWDHLVLELADSRPDVIHKIVPLIEEAYIMGVKLNKALVEHKLSQDFTADPNDVEKCKALREERIRLVELLADNNETLKFMETQTP